MHEVSLVRSLLSQVLVAAEPLPPACIRKVFVSAGPLSGVEPLLVAQSFKDLRANFGLDLCELSIDEPKLEALCLQCNVSFEIVDYVFICPHCQSSSVRVTQGDDFLLLRLEVYDTECSLHFDSTQDESLNASGTRND
jgi:hydrogenase nickel incorporation protein HypA/HybF